MTLKVRLDELVGDMPSGDQLRGQSWVAVSADPCGGLKVLARPLSVAHVHPRGDLDVPTSLPIRPSGSLGLRRIKLE
jgi:hypothetical protein